MSSRKGNWTKAYEEFQQIATERGITLEEMSIAFFAYDDYSASELISLCLEKGLKVPENVAVLGVNNDELINSGLAISLSSVDSDLEGLGRRGAQLLRDSFERPDATWEACRIMRHPPKGIIGRKSTDYYAVRSPMVAKALHWIHNNYQNAIQAIDVSKALGVTQQGLQRAFAQHHLRSPGEEIRYQRVHAANHRLIHSSDPLETIACACGYNSVHSLIRNYRTVFGITPGQHRKKK